MGKMYVSLRLTSNSKSPEQFFSELGVVAEKSWRKGDIRKKTRIVEKENGYEFVAVYARDATFDEMVSGLLARLEPISGKIRTLACDHVQLTCAVYSKEAPAIQFSPLVIEDLSRMGASIDIDLYIADANWAE
jgi:hypothetical protein